ncbi:Aldo/keto reductase [Dichomitus squalens LYAD-421 SS1]|uniref:Aldo/keto reductase n=1 Tax=Dichomitus squalens (strain LYAD-421) TaxID=732165 RepID=UPI0004415F76|nr:Aldo/keto reductase [Dichomitus squalens LYAD-421 SS1]EJF64727.1 Aldo/keto reductase [Dichomitus squalens LYAD-421 SS1]
MALSAQSKLKLNDGNEIPIIGFGTYEMEGEEAYNAVRWALEAGYRHIDSAQWYENEKEVGRAILDWCKATETPRETVFYTTKLKYNNGYANAKEAMRKSVAECGLGYVDLYLLHGPIGGREMRLQSWKAAIDAKKEGLFRSIGVSCFSIRHLKELIDAGLEVPAVNQIDLHPFMTRTDIVAFCRQHNIVLEAWAPLVRGLRFRHPKIVALAEKYKKDPAHVLLRWSLQKGFVAIPKSAKRSRIVSNINLFDFELIAGEVAELDALDEYLVTDWDPTNAP